MSRILSLRLIHAMHALTSMHTFMAYSEILQADTHMPC